MKAFLIDPTNETITEVEQNGLRDLYNLIGCRTVTTAYLNHSDALYLDDEGIDDDKPVASFKVAGLPNIFCGKAVVVGTDDEGGDMPPTCTLKALNDRVSFLGKKLVTPFVGVSSWPM